MRFSDLHKMSDGTLVGTFPLFPRTQVKAAKLIVISFASVVGEQQTWKESASEILDHVKELQPNVALNAGVKSQLVAIKLGLPGGKLLGAGAVNPLTCPPCDPDFDTLIWPHSIL